MSQLSVIISTAERKKNVSEVLVGRLGQQLTKITISSKSCPDFIHNSISASSMGAWWMVVGQGWG